MDYALFSGHATARLKACWRKILPERVHTMRSCAHALALNDIRLIFFWRIRHPGKHEIKKASFFGRGDIFKK